MRQIFFLAMMCFLFFQVNAQRVNLKLAIVDDTELNQITNCNIKISGNKSTSIYLYFNTGDKNTFDKDLLPQLKDDSLRVSISHINYRDTTITISSRTTLTKFTAKLGLKNIHLEDIDIKGPPMWKRGDTTNFRADAFKEGDEKKLKDLVKKMPDFVLEENGGLFYKNKPVDRIMVDGEELFADKVKLLLNSFPVHVIDLVQVTENQSGNKLLSGFTGSETYLNLTLKKNVFKLSFGDFEAGVGNKDRYMINGVLFSLGKNLKLGYIGNLNSVGDGLDWKLKNEVKTQAEQEVESLATLSNPTNFIPNLTNRYYLHNNLFDNRINLLIPVSKNIKAKTELTYLSDRQNQTSYNENTFYNGQAYINRQENSLSTYKPKLFNIKQTLNFELNSKNLLQFKASWLSDRSQGKQNSVFIQNATNSNIYNLIENNFNSIAVNAALTNRTDQKRASETTLDFNIQTIRQSIDNISPQWNEIFGLQDYKYNQLNQDIDNIYRQFRLSHQRYFTLNGSKIKWDNRLQIYSLKRIDQAVLSDSLQKLSITPPIGNDNGVYTRRLLTSGISGRNGSVDNSLGYTVNLGLSQTTLLENDLKQKYVLPEFEGNIQYGYTTFSKIRNITSLSLTNSAIPIQSINNTYRPTTLSSYDRILAINKSLKAITLSHNVFYKWPNQLGNSSVYFSYNYDFNKAIPNFYFRDFLSFRTDSLVNKGVNGFRISTKQVFPSLMLKAVIEINASFSESKNLLPILQNVSIVVSQNSTLEVLLKKNWNKSYYLTLGANYIGNQVRTPDVLISQNNSITKSADIVSSIKQRLILKNNINISLNTKLVYNNLNTNYTANFMLMDLELNMKPRVVPLYFSVKGENLTNRKFYTVFYQFDANQTLNQVPLIGRSFYLSIRYEI